MRRLWKWLVLGVLVVVALGFAGWYFFLKTDPEPRAAIKETPVVTEDTAGGGTAAASGLDGTWTVTSGNPQNFVGYRVTEKLFANISETEATGRTDNVEASMTIDGTTVKDVTVTADLRDLTSDNSFRDGRIKSEGLESDEFPEAKFVLTQPITLSAVPAAGETINDRGRRRVHPARGHQAGDDPARGPLGRQAGAGRGQPGDRVRRLRRLGPERSCSGVGRRSRRDGAPALLRQELTRRRRRGDVVT